MDGTVSFYEWRLGYQEVLGTLEPYLTQKNWLEVFVLIGIGQLRCKNFLVDYSLPTIYLSNALFGGQYLIAGSGAVPILNLVLKLNYWIREFF